MEKALPPTSLHLAAMAQAQALPAGAIDATAPTMRHPKPQSIEAFSAGKPPSRLAGLLGILSPRDREQGDHFLQVSGRRRFVKVRNQCCTAPLVPRSR
jgi:hypothetical protein